MMSENKRDSNSAGLVFDIKLTCGDQSEYIFKSRNISDNGVFLEHGDPPSEFDALRTSYFTSVLSIGR